MYRGESKIGSKLKLWLTKIDDFDGLFQEYELPGKVINIFRIDTFKHIDVHVHIHVYIHVVCAKYSKFCQKKTYFQTDQQNCHFQWTIVGPQLKIAN